MVLVVPLIIVFKPFIFLVRKLLSTITHHDSYTYIHTDRQTDKQKDFLLLFHDY